MPRRLVRLVHHQDVAEPRRLDQRRVLHHQRAAVHLLARGQLLHRRVAVELDVLARPPEQLQEAVGQLVLAHALVADQEQVLEAEAKAGVPAKR